MNKPEVVVILADEKFDVGGNFMDERAKILIKQLLENLAKLAEMLKANAKF